MHTTWSHPVPVSRAIWQRFGEAATALLSSSRRLLHSWRDAQRRAAELRMLRELSPAVLRDIGAEPETIYESQRREQALSGREAVLRLL